MHGADILQAHIARAVSLTPEQHAAVFARFTPLSLKKGQSLIQEGDRVDGEYFVLAGCLKSYFLNDEAKMFILQFAMPTWWASDYQALYSGQRATITVDCITPAEVLKLANADREELCAAIPAVAHFFRWRTNRGYVALQQRLLSLMNNDVKKRYEELLQQYPELYNLVPKQLIAAYLGVSRETLSRLYHP